MGRMHTHRHGKSHSRRPVEIHIPQWIPYTPKQVEELVVKYARDGLTPSQIGIKLRDQHAIPLVKPIVGKTIGRILEQNELKPDMPEDLDNMVKKAVGLQRHLRENRGDRRNVRSLELIEAKVHRLSVYYKREGRIPNDWKYKSVVAQLE
ncbi:MAG: 30S ribosomal protein S15 [Cenarchaeum sp. SB0665_bin_23]|nr:30S ribosomal protein S15 [Cenarchaeum sp. SB0665_bin_23]MYB46498.1 30S ribosomal protein S15 [Cenarchaeum sp. SB0662_bin_33]MYG33719.1 30S ribosomal protein S15 [Cenarchaeum sp. SB0677_bin_16]